MITEEQIKKGIDEAYEKIRHNAYFDNGFRAGVMFAQSILKDSDSSNVKHRFIIGYKNILTDELNCDEVEACNQYEAIGKFINDTNNCNKKWLSVKDLSKKGTE